MQNARYWIGTIPASLNWTVPTGPLEAPLIWLKGQQELAEGGLLHYQVVAGFSRNVRLSQLGRLLPGHWEPTRSAAADDYVWKEDTRVADTQFEIGTKPIRRNVAKDWDQILASAKSGNLESIPSDIVVRCFSNLTRIAAHFAEPVALQRVVNVFWGRTETGKSRRAWEEAGLCAYPKSPSTKWWDGYRGHEHVVIDEFRGEIGIGHLLRWFDRYPVIVETKGGSVVLKATQIWITSNLSVEQWYPTLDSDTLSALRRRLNITHFNYCHALLPD